MFGLQKKRILYGGDGSANNHCIAAVIAEAGFEGRRFEGVRDCLRALKSQRCDLLIANAARPAVEGMTLLVKAGALHTDLPVIMLVERNDVATTVAAMKAGACDCLERPPAPMQLRAAIDRVLQAYEPQEPLLNAPLSPTERRVLDLVLRGFTNRDIAALLKRSRRTIEVHRRHLMRKAGVKNVVQLAHKLASNRWPGKYEPGAH